MTDLPFSPSQPVNTAGRLAPAIARLIALVQSACATLTRAAAAHSRRMALRRAPDEILAAQARREDARRAADQLWLRR